MRHIQFLLIPFLLFGFLLTSCKSDDDGNDNVDRIVGSWEITDLKLNGTSVYDVVILMPEGCFLKSKVHFYNDSTLKANPFMLDEQENCVEQPEQSGTWTSNGNTYTYQIGESSSDSQTVTFENNNKFYYSFSSDQGEFQVNFSRM